MKNHVVGLIIAMVMPLTSSAAFEICSSRRLGQETEGAGGPCSPKCQHGSRKDPIHWKRESAADECPFCQRFHLTTFNALKEKYIDTGIARFYSRDLPLEMHRNALRAAQAARCAGDQGHFWEMRNLLQISSDKLELENLAQYAGELKLDGDQFQQCVTNEKYRAAVEADAAQAKGIGAEATPSFLIGTSTPDGVDGQLMMGALLFEAFDRRLQQLRSK